MLVFLDFEASSLSDDSYPIEVGWVFADGHGAENWLIRPAPAWTDWDASAEAVHGLSRRRLMADGASHETVAQRMIEVLGGHDLCASAPSWDGKWLSVLLRGAGLPRHALRLRDSDDAHLEAARTALAASTPAEMLEDAAAAAVDRAQARLAGESIAHRALADAELERRIWLAVQQEADARA
jgi:hypothetical protein